MKYKNKNQSKVFSVVFIILILIIATVFFVKVALEGPGSTRSKASRNETLTPGNDLLSIQEDYKMLKAKNSDELDIEEWLNE